MELDAFCTVYVIELVVLGESSIVAELDPSTVFVLFVYPIMLSIFIIGTEFLIILNAPAVFVVYFPQPLILTNTKILLVILLGVIVAVIPVLENVTDDVFSIVL